MATAIKAIETTYKGRRFRSRLEARYAVFLDEAGLKWEYEAEGFDLGDEGYYLPDFWLPNERAYVEVKPCPLWNPETIYLAGKCHNGWRRKMDVAGNLLAPPFSHRNDENHCEPMDAKELFETCLEGIRKANAIVAWIDNADCYGTLIELGLARAWGKRVAIGFDSEFYSDLRESDANVLEELGRKPHEIQRASDMWFAEQAANTCAVFESPERYSQWLVSSGFISPMPPEYRKLQKLCRDTRCDGWVVFSPESDEWRDARCFRFNKLGEVVTGCNTWPGVLIANAVPKGQFSHDVLTRCLRAMLSARFEHGESP